MREPLCTELSETSCTGFSPLYATHCRFPTGPDADHQKELDKLNGLSGADFDKEYMSQMVTDHAKALSAFTTAAKDTKDVKFRTAVIKGKTAVAAHKNMAYDLKKKL